MKERERFDTLGTIGVEEEFYVVDSETLQPVPASDSLLEDPPRELQDHLDTELFKFVLETTTDTATSVGDARDQVAEKREALKSYVRSYGYEVLAAGLHPSARWIENEQIQKPRYTKQLERIGYPQHRNTTAGLHVHIGVDDADTAVCIANEIRRYLPMYLALGANSPFWQGYETGLRSARAVVFENLPNTGMPTAFDSWRDFRSFEKRMVEEGSIKDRGEIWWDVRPNTRYGTVEIRSPDSQTSIERVVGFVALTRALVLDLYSDCDRGGHTDVRREILDENKWRALRHGHDASFLRTGEGETGVVELEDLFDDVVGSLEGQKLSLAESLIEESGAQRQIEAYNENENENEAEKEVFRRVCEEIKI
ncbi:glutamate--cysteine ligase [Halorutilales archaeon Cl-col2-1]